jgi:hypothetical protein
MKEPGLVVPHLPAKSLFTIPDGFFCLKKQIQNIIVTTLFRNFITSQPSTSRSISAKQCFANPGCLFWIPDPGSKRFRIPDQDPQRIFAYLIPKIISKLSEKWSGMFIPDPVFSHTGSRIQGSKRHQIPDPQYWCTRKIMFPLDQIRNKLLCIEVLFKTYCIAFQLYIKAISIMYKNLAYRTKYGIFECVNEVACLLSLFPNFCAPLVDKYKNISN